MSRSAMSEIRTGEILHPLGFNVKVQIEIPQTEELLASGVYVATNVGMSQERLARGADRGVILEYGPLVGTCEGLHAYGIQIGNKVTFERYDGQFYEEAAGSGKGIINYILIREDQIHGLIETEETGDK